jgi:DNA-binding NarL/FixJ family response regulator
MLEGIAAVRECAARASLNPALWPDTLRHLSCLLRSDMTVFDHVDKASGAVEIGFNDRPDIVGTAREAYESHFFAENIRYQASRGLPPDAVHHDDLVGDEKALGRSEFYVDFLAPLGLKYFIGTSIAGDAEQAIILSLQRGADRGRYSEAERASFAAVLPDLRNAIAIYSRMVQAPPSETLAGAFDRLADPVAIVRKGGRVKFANAAMRLLLANGDLLRLRHGQLAGVGDLMSSALARVLAVPAASAARAGRLILRTAPLDQGVSRGFSDSTEPLFLLMVDDPARPCWPDVDEAMALFGLTRREAAVGIHIAAGLSVDDIAHRLGISRNTVRTHLAVLRDKLGVRTALAAAATLRHAVSPFT